MKFFSRSVKTVRIFLIDFDINNTLRIKPKKDFNGMKKIITP